jgi:hypothetical protein
LAQLIEDSLLEEINNLN